MLSVILFVGGVVALLVIATWPDGGVKLGWGHDHDADRKELGERLPGKAPDSTHDD